MSDEMDRTRALSLPVMELLGALGIDAIIFYGGCNVIRGHSSSPAHSFSFLAALLMPYAPIKEFIGGPMSYPRRNRLRPVVWPTQVEGKNHGFPQYII